MKYLYDWVILFEGDWELKFLDDISVDIIFSFSNKRGGSLEYTDSCTVVLFLFPSYSLLYSVAL